MEALFQDDVEGSAPQEPLAEESQFTPEFLVFKVGELRCAIPLMRIKEVAEEIGITPVPNVSFSIAGVVNLRGSVIPVLDLKNMLGVREEIRSRQVLILRQDPPVGLLIEGTLQITPFLKSVVKAFLPQAQEELKNFAQASIELQGAPPIIVLDADLLIGIEKIFPS